MERSQLALKLMLDELGLDPTIRTVRERKAVQKAIYLGQAAGVDLGYRYNWYIMGPYSPGLTRDYFALDEALNAGDKSAEGYELQATAKAQVGSVKPLMDVPEGVDLNQSEWLELLASVHFLIKRRRLNLPGAKELLQKQKPHVAPFTEKAARMLENQRLIDG